MKNTKKNHVNIILMFGSIFLFLLLFEVILNLNYNFIYKNKFNNNFFNNEKVISHMKPNSIIGHYIYYSSMNSNGFRDNEYSIQKPDFIYRIAVIGDSFTYGHGLENYNDSYPNILEKTLNKKFDGNYEVLNFGLLGTNILDIYWIFTNKVIKYNPNLVIYGYNQNDLEFYKENIEFNFCRELSNKTKTSLVVEFIEKNIYYSYLRLSKASENQYFVEATKNNSLPNRCLKNVFNQINVLSKKENFDVLIFTIPNFRSNNISIEIEKNICNISNELNFRCISNFSKEFWEKTKDISNEDLIMDGHFSKNSNLIIADMIEDFILK